MRSLAVGEDTSASLAGIEAGDTVVSVDGVSIAAVRTAALTRTQLHYRRIR